jgi:flagellar hook-length control protein FliK
MAVVPDFKLSSTPDISSIKTAVKAPERLSEPAHGNAPRFADVYAKEQQPARNEPRTERRESGSKPDSRHDVSERKNDSTEKVASADTKQNEAVELAEDGKSLPVGDEQPPVVEAQLDPLFLLGMTGELPAQVAPLPVADTVSSLTQGGLALTSGTVEADSLDLTSQVGSLAVAQLLDASGSAKSEAPAAHQLAQASGALMQQPVDGKPTAQVNAAASQESGKQAAMMAALLNSDAQAQPGSEDMPLEALEALKGVDDKGSVGGRNDAFADKLNGLTQTMASPVQTARPVAPTVPGQALAMDQSSWSEGVVDRVMWMSSQNIKTADIRLEPAGLGRLEVRIDMTQDQAQVTFASPHADVREALDNQSHRLREMFVQQGMNLNVNVSDQSAHRQWQSDQQEAGAGHRRSSNTSGAGTDDSIDEVAGLSSEVSARTIKRNDGTVDFYA